MMCAPFKTIRKAYALFAFVMVGISLAYQGKPCFAVGMSTPTNHSERSPSAELSLAQKAFTEKKYDESIDHYRRYLRSHPSDPEACTQIGAAYFYAGDIDNGLIWLKRGESKTVAKSYNAYHQGMSHLVLKSKDDARSALTRAARYADEYGARAILELAVLEYRDGNSARTRYWTTLYRQRFPQGPAIPMMSRIDQNVAASQFGDKSVTGAPLPDRLTGVMRYSPLSLSKLPHFWFIQPAYRYDFGDQVQPDSNSDTGTKVESYSRHDLSLDLGIGVGPLTQKQTSTWLGYHYRQDWFSDQDRFEDFLNAGTWTDYFTYLPFRPDLLERSHRLFGLFEVSLFNFFAFGAQVHQEYMFAGSSLIPGPEGDQIDQYSEKIAESSMLLPYASATIANIWTIKAHMLFYKELRDNAPEYSYKTYNLFGTGDPLLSVGISNRFNFPDINLRIFADVLHYEYVYNDYWSDFTRLAGMGGVEFDFEKGFGAFASGAYYQDTYQLPALRMNGCVFRQRESSDNTSKEPEECSHTDTGTVLQAGLTYRPSIFSRFSLEFSNTDNRSPTLVVYERTDSFFKLSYTFAFPSYDNTNKFMNRYDEEKYARRTE